MRFRTDVVSREEIVFFGKVSAGISHELKNIMATISETASLLVDLVEFWEKGGKLEQGELLAYSKGIMEDIQRAFTTIRDMNSFAHSVDEPLKEVGVAEVLELMVSLWKYMSAGKKVSLDFPEGTGPKVLTSPFLLQDLIYHALLFAFESVEPDGEIKISLSSADKDVRIDFSGIEAVGVDSFLNEKGKVIAAEIHAEVLPFPSGGGFSILLPPRLSLSENG